MSTETDAKLAAYRDALDIVRECARGCTEIGSLEMDVTDTLERRIADLEAQAKAGKKDKGKGRG